MAENENNLLNNNNTVPTVPPAADENEVTKLHEAEPKAEFTQPSAENSENGSTQSPGTEPEVEFTEHTVNNSESVTDTAPLQEESTTQQTSPPPPPPQAPKYEAPKAPQNQTYTWQNPNPYNSGYNGYNTYTPPPKPVKPKRKLTGTEIALICVGGISVLLLIAVIVMFSIVVSRSNIDNPTEDKEHSQQQQSPSDDDNNQEEIQRPTEDLPTLETQEPTTDELSIPDIYEKVKDSVVGITVTVTGQMGIEQGSGTGIILSEDGYISTNAHVVDGASTIKVILTDESEHNAQLIGIDTRTDLAVLKIEKTGLKPAEFGNSDSLRVGESVVAIGNPYGMELAGTVTSGIVSALNRQIVIESFYMTLIQTDASINPGNSGGPLVNSYGQVIGVTSSKIVQSGYEGIGFAIPMSTATSIIQDLIQYGYIKDRPYIGITGYDIDEASAAMYSLPQGVRVESVDPESDAYKKGLKRGDIIVAVNGIKIESMADLESEKNKKKPGDELTLTVYRNTKEIDITIILSESTAD